MKSLLRRKKLIWTAVILGLLGYYLRYMSLQINGARYTATVMHMANCVNNASITILDYWKENGVTRLPDDVVSSTGEPILSWRVRLLSVDPEGRKIKIDETQSWDSPANAKALEHLPDFCSLSPFFKKDTGKNAGRNSKNLRPVSFALPKFKTRWKPAFNSMTTILI